MWWYGFYKTRNILVQHSEFLYPSTRVHYKLNYTIYYQCADMPTCLHLMHVAATCGQATYAPEIFHIRLQEEPTILLYSKNHGEIQTWNIQYESSRRVYLQSLPPETTKWVYKHNQVEIQTSNIQDEYAKWVYVQSLPQENTIWVQSNSHGEIEMKYSIRVFDMSIHTKSSTRDYRMSLHP